MSRRYMIVDASNDVRDGNPHCRIMFRNEESGALYTLELTAPPQVEIAEVLGAVQAFGQHLERSVFRLARTETVSDLPTAENPSGIPALAPKAPVIALVPKSPRK